MVKLWAGVWCLVFLTHSVYICIRCKYLLSIFSTVFMDRVPEIKTDWLIEWPAQGTSTVPILSAHFRSLLWCVCRKLLVPAGYFRASASSRLLHSADLHSVDAHRHTVVGRVLDQQGLGYPSLNVVLLGCVAGRPVNGWRLPPSNSTQKTNGCGVGQLLCFRCIQANLPPTWRHRFVCYAHALRATAQ